MIRVMSYSVLLGSRMQLALGLLLQLDDTADAAAWRDGGSARGYSTCHACGMQLCCKYSSKQQDVDAQVIINNDDVCREKDECC